MKFFLFLIKYIILFSGISLAQEIPAPINIQSPNAAGIGKYGDVEVSHFTGEANISIPLHNLSVNGIDLSIDLNYDAGGIRIDQHPGWVGQNWSLSVGGVITRTVRGDFDEGTLSNTNFPNIIYPNFGYFYNYDQLNLSLAQDQNHLKTIAYNSYLKGYDYQPDIFTFNVMGMSGKFYFGNDGEWKVESDRNVMLVYEDYLISPLFENIPEYPAPHNYKYPQVIGGFKLIDDMGTTYVFGYDVEAIEFSIDFFRQYYPPYGSPWIANSWYLTKIIDKNGTEVYRFNYERGAFIAHFYRTDGVKQWSYDGEVGMFDPVPSCVNNPSLIYEESYIEGNLISPTYLKNIFTPVMSSTEPTVSFWTSDSDQLKYDPVIWETKYLHLQNQCFQAGYGPYPIYYLQVDNSFIDPSLADDYMENLKWKKLDKINIYGKLNKQIRLHYNDISNERLNLKKLEVVSDEWPYNPNSESYSYLFEYNQFDNLPGYLSKMEDHWGFYKGTSYSYSISNLPTFFEQRLPDPAQLTIGLLSEIHYPTGGYSFFEYEPHDYSKIVTDDRQSIVTESEIAGGVRIRKIENFDGEIVTNSRTYIYKSNYASNPNSPVSSGVLSSKPKYYWPDWRVSNGDQGEYSHTTFSVNSIIPLANSFGSHIGYTEVTEVNSNGSFTTYHFSNFDTSNDYMDLPALYSFNSMHSPYSIFTEKNLMRGKLLRKIEYSSENLPVKETIFGYRQDPLMYQQCVFGANVSMNQFCPEISFDSYYYGNTYMLYYFDYDLISEETIDYTTDGIFSQHTLYTRIDKQVTTTYGASDIRLLKEKKIISSENDNSEEMEFSLYEYVTIADFIDSPIMINDNGDDNPEHRADINNCFTPMIENNLLSFPVETRISVNKAGDQLKHTSGQAYKYNTSDPNDFSYLKPVETFIFETNEPLINSDYVTLSEDGELLIPSGYKLDTKYSKYDQKGNINEFKLNYDQTKTYLWGYNHTLLIANVENASYDLVASELAALGNPIDNLQSKTDNQLRQIFNNLRARPAMKDAMITSYTHKPLVGMTSETDPDGMTTFYEYDNFGRLQYIKNHEGHYIKEYKYHYGKDEQTNSIESK